ncbi:hypothetical protein FKM82_028599 [Ascaphus truei]
MSKCQCSRVGESSVVMSVSQGSRVGESSVVMSVSQGSRAGEGSVVKSNAEFKFKPRESKQGQGQEPELKQTRELGIDTAHTGATGKLCRAMTGSTEGGYIGRRTNMDEGWSRGLSECLQG